jgi:phospholipase/lecithinase/hemolysin
MCKNFLYSIMAAFLALASQAAMAATPSYDALYVFGDSYCDVGNLFLATGGAKQRRHITTEGFRMDPSGSTMRPAFWECLCNPRC